MKFITWLTACQQSKMILDRRIGEILCFLGVGGTWRRGYPWNEGKFPFIMKYIQILTFLLRGDGCWTPLLVLGISGSLSSLKYKYLLSFSRRPSIILFHSHFKFTIWGLQWRIIFWLFYFKNGADIRFRPISANPFSRQTIFPKLITQKRLRSHRIIIEHVEPALITQNPHRTRLNHVEPAQIT